MVYCRGVAFSISMCEVAVFFFVVPECIPEVSLVQDVDVIIASPMRFTLMLSFILSV